MIKAIPLLYIRYHALLRTHPRLLYTLWGILWPPFADSLNWESNFFGSVYAPPQQCGQDLALCFLLTGCCAVRELLNRSYNMCLGTRSIDSLVFWPLHYKVSNFKSEIEVAKYYYSCVSNLLIHRGVMRRKLWSFQFPPAISIDFNRWFFGLWFLSLKIHKYINHIPQGLLRI